MKHDEKPATSPKSRSPEVPDESGKHKLGKTMKDEPHAPDGSAQEIDRPGFDLGGLLAIRMPERAWAWALMHPTPRVTDGFPGAGLTTS